MPTIDLRRIDTTPGADNPFAPPLGFEGGADEYGAWLYQQYKACPATPQYMYALWRLTKLDGTVQPVNHTGPYAARLMAAMARFEQMMMTPATGE